MRDFAEFAFESRFAGIPEWMFARVGVEGTSEGTSEGGILVKIEARFELKSFGSPFKGFDTRSELKILCEYAHRIGMIPAYLTRS